MLREGHVGVVLALYAPIGFVVAFAGHRQLAITGAVVAVGLAMLPDIDLKIPFVSHRGITHTVWFALVTGAGLGWAGYVIALDRGIRWTPPVLDSLLDSTLTGAIGLGAFGVLLGIVIILGHVLGDALTPMGIRPSAPLSDRSYSLDMASASNSLANYLLLVLGLLLSGGALYVAGGG